MGRLSSLMVRASFGGLVAGFVIGGMVPIDRTLPGEWRFWASPTQGHILFVGWLVQFALGIAFWPLPRRRTPERPLGSPEGIAYGAVAALNLRAIGEPAERAGFAGG
jgi:hypothetical protein